MLEVLRGASGRSRVGLLLLGVPFLLCLGTAPLFDVDEGAFAEASREMWASADFGHTTLNGVDRFDKPVAVYWVQALAIGLLGPGEWAVRLPSALCAWALCVAVAKFACTQWGRATGGWAAVLLASNLGLLVIGRASTADALLNLCLGLTALDLCRHLMTGSAWPLRRAALWVGIGVMTKGPVAVLIPGATLCLWWLSYRDGKKARQALGDLWSWAIVSCCGRRSYCPSFRCQTRSCPTTLCMPLFRWLCSWPGRLCNMAPGCGQRSGWVSEPGWLS